MAQEPSSLQDRFAPNNRCFGCGPANELGLRIKSFPVDGDAEHGLEATWTPESHHEAFTGMVNGGILGALLDCHSNWAAAWVLMNRDGEDTPPCTVTADFHVKLQLPTPSDKTLRIVARPVRVGRRSVEVEAEVTVDGEVTASCSGNFVAVKPGHPAYHRW